MWAAYVVGQQGHGYFDNSDCRYRLKEFNSLPDMAEYMQRDGFDVAKKYVKDTFLSVKHLGTDLLPKLFAAKGRPGTILNKLQFLSKTTSKL